MTFSSIRNNEKVKIDPGVLLSWEHQGDIPRIGAIWKLWLYLFP